MRITLTTRLLRPLRATALAAALAAISAPAAHAEDLPPQSIDANAEFLAYAGPPPVPGRVCVVDTGVDLTTDAAANVEARYSIYGGTLDDVGGSGIAKHGTYVAGIVASRLDGHGSVGIWPQARIISVRVFADGSSGSSVIAYLEALDACRDWRARPSSTCRCRASARPRDRSSPSSRTRSPTCAASTGTSTWSRGRATTAVRSATRPSSAPRSPSAPATALAASARSQAAARSSTSRPSAAAFTCRCRAARSPSAAAPPSRRPWSAQRWRRCAPTARG